MGDPLSPVICMTVCGYHEHKYTNSWSAGLPGHTRFCRYMDDVYMITTLPDDKVDVLTKDYTERCYPKCLELEDTDPKHYLETEVIVNDDDISIKHWTKNYEHLKAHGQQLFYTHQHSASYGPMHTKRGAIIGTWTRMMSNCNNDALLGKSIEEKMSEFKHLGYGTHIMNKTMDYMHKKTGHHMWRSFQKNKKRNTDKW